MAQDKEKETKKLINFDNDKERRKDKLRRDKERRKDKFKNKDSK